MFRVKRKSEAFKYGEGDSHTKAKFRIVGILEKYINESRLYNVHKSKVYTERKLYLTAALEHYEKNGIKTHIDFIYEHPYDVWIHLHVIKTKLDRDIVLEIDGKSHEKLKQQKNDRRAELALTNCTELFRDFPDCEIRRIHIENALYDSDEDLIKLILYPQ